ncbi:MAG: signal peptidase II [Micavibrio aeruginosavorus]|jgi:signal peptidase II|uniref:Lipoprotein signal peptidase n=1 Tax=Micavibrio aeruginosavorus TaxID=349221 RepID=A0A2W5H991_9BACT|nr:MAG: signal peptidase II [Micavibrio aeruginosavorus]
MTKPIIALAILAGAAADLIVKAWARAVLEPYATSQDFLPFLSLRLTFNKGVSFSMFSVDGNNEKFALLFFTALVTLAIAIWAFRTPHERERSALAAIVAGALGNLIDRAYFGNVTDFLSLHFGTLNLFVFNLADVWISLGVLALLFLQFKGDKREAN